MLYANSPIPLYEQLYRYLRQAIDEGELPVGAKLPSERQVAAEYGISRITARKAYGILRKEGYIRAFQGKGAFVAQSTSLSDRHAPVETYAEMVLKMNMMPSTKLLSCGIARISGEIARQLDATDLDEAIKIRRLRLADGVPIALETAYVPYHRCAAVLTVDLERCSLYRTMQERSGIALDHADQSLQRVLTSDGDIQLLGLMPPTAVVRVRRRTYDTADQVVEYRESLYLGKADRLKAFAGFG